MCRRSTDPAAGQTVHRVGNHARTAGDGGRVLEMLAAKVSRVAHRKELEVMADAVGDCHANHASDCPIQLHVA